MPTKPDLSRLNHNLLAKKFPPQTIKATAVTNPNQHSLLNSTDKTRKKILIGAATAIILILVTGLGYFFVFNKPEEKSDKDSSAHANFLQQAQQPQPTLVATPTPTDLPLPDYGKISTWENYTFPGFDQYKTNDGNFIFKGFTIYFPQQAQVNKLLSHTKPQQLNLSIEVNGIKLNLDTGSEIPNICTFSDNQNANSQGLINSNHFSLFRELGTQDTNNQSQPASWRLGVPQLESYQKKPELVVCQKRADGEVYRRSTDIGAITIELPQKFKPDQILSSAEMDPIFKILNNIETFEPTEPLLVPTPSPDPLTQTFSNEYYPYQISYPEDWRFRKTYGEDIVTQTRSDIISGFDLHKGNDYYTKASFVFNLLDSHGHDDIKDWIDEYDPNTPEDAETEEFEFKDNDAIKYTVVKTKTENEAPTGQKPEQIRERIYFIKDDYVYRLIYWEKTEIGPTLEEIVNSFQPIDY